METQNIIALISGEGTTLQSLIDNCKSTKIVGVLSDELKANGITRAQQANIPHILVVERRHNETKEHHSDRMKDALDIVLQMQDNIRYIVLTGFMTILTADFIHHFNEKDIQIINIHPSLLPKYKGLNTYKRALENEDEKQGMTIHYVDEELDSGPILFQVSFDITDRDNIKSIERKTKELEQRWYPKVIDSLFTKEPLVYF